MTDELFITRVTPELMDDIERIEKLCFTLPWSRKGLEDDAASACGCWLAVLDANGVPRAFMGCHIFDTEAEIVNIAVEPDYRRRGLARRLIKYFFAKNPQLDKVFLEVRKANLPARSLYRSLGFEQYGVRKNYYEQPREDAILMCCEPQRR